MLKKILSIIGILMIIGGTTVSVMKWQKIGPFSDKKVEKTPVKKVKVEEPPRFIDMEPLVIPVLQGDRVATTIQIQIKLEAVGSENENKIIKIMPRLSDAFIRELYSFIPRLLRKEKRLDIAILKKRLQMTSDKVTGPKVVKSVLIQSVVDRPSR